MEVRVRDASGAPLAGAIVRLVDSAGRSRAQGLASDAGRIVLQAPGPGRWRLKVDGIGYQGHESEAFTMAAGEMGRREVSLEKNPVELPDLETTVMVGCGAEARSGAGRPEVMALWDEIQKALVATRITQEGELVLVRGRIWERRLDRQRAVVREDLLTDRVTSGVPFVTLSPEALARNGFVSRNGIIEFYAGPDAALLTSEAFLATHCFRAVPAPRGQPGLVGLGFRPIETREVPDIDGVLWIDRPSRELRFLEYRYTGLAGAASRSEAGGRVEFQRLPSGAWIVDDWWIRTPAVAQVVDRATGLLSGRDSLMGYTETAGRAEVVPRGTTITGPTGPPAVLVGTLRDSLTRGALVGARVSVPGAKDTAVTDAEGRFRLEVAGAGERVVTVSHPKLGLVADRSTQALRFVPGQETALNLAVPPIEAFVRVFCPAGERGEAGLLGLTLANGVPVEHLEVRLAWVATAGTRGVQQRVAETRSIARGLYTFCDLPAARVIQVELRQGNRVITTERVELGRGEFRWVELDGGR
jgi:hypothetical protein